MKLLFVAKFAQSAFSDDMGPRGLEKGQPVFLEIEDDMAFSLLIGMAKLRPILRLRILICGNLMIFGKWVRRLYGGLL